MLHDFYKPAGQRCPHQRHTGCAVYAKRPLGCRMWSCRWLVSDDTAELRRPDRAGYVVDMVPDFIRLKPNDGSEPMTMQVVQIWADPKRRDDWFHDEALLRYLERRAAEGIAALVRFDSHDAVGVFAPAISSDYQWHVMPGGQLMRERTTWPGATPQPVKEEENAG
jgi:hypothetical protein